uniref:Uncharacterized protein n=1 Tax=Triticum urartu TaxID=4572 RepID=A0A8R7QGN2_TRIUA
MASLLYLATPEVGEEAEAYAASPAGSAPVAERFMLKSSAPATKGTAGVLFRPSGGGVVIHAMNVSVAAVPSFSRENLHSFFNNQRQLTTIATSYSSRQRERRRVAT